MKGRDSLKAKYYIETKKDLREVAEFLVELETTGKWSGNKESTELYKLYKGEDPNLPFMNLVDNMEARLERKLWIHNGGHATVAYL